MSAKRKWFDENGNRMPCTEEGCDSLILQKGLCRKHYFRGRKGPDYVEALRIPKVDSEGNPLPCHFPDCGRNIRGAGLCTGHLFMRSRGEELRPLFAKYPCPVNGCERKMMHGKELCPNCVSFTRKFGLTVEETVAVFEVRVCVNPGCDNTERLYMDHDHACCEIPPFCGNCNRGLLCQGCNTALGHATDSKERLQGLIQYLESWEKTGERLTH